MSYSLKANSDILRIDLDNAIQIAATNYFLLQTIKNKNSAIKELITERWRDLLPTLGVNVIRQRYIITDSNDYIYNGIMMNLEQIVYDGGRKSLDLDIARLEELLSKEEFRITYAKLKLDVEKAFMNVLIASGKIVLNQKSLERAREQLRLSKVELELGFATDVQVMSIISRQQEIEFALAKSRNEFLKAKNELKLIMGLNYEAEILVLGDLLEDFHINKPKIEKSELIERARHERPEIMKARVNHHKVEKEKELAENAWIPQVSIGGAYGKTGIEYPLRNDSWNLNFKISVPLGGSTNTTTESVGLRNNNLASSGFGGNANPNFNSSTNNDFQFLNNMGQSRRIMESKVKLGAAISERKYLERSIAIEVEKSIDSVLEAYDLIRIGSGTVFFRYESLKLMATRSQVGDAKRSDILFAETELVEAQEKLVEALGKYMVSSYELEWVSGLVPDTLNLFKYSPKKGNTILPFLLLDKPIDKEKIPEGLRPKDMNEFFEKDIEQIPSPNGSRDF